MPLQNAVTVTVASAPETTFGTAPAGGATFRRRTTSSVNLEKETFASNEVRTDLQVSDMRHGSRRVSGQIDGELSTASYDDWLEAIMGGSWAAGATANQATLTNLSTDGTGRVVVGAGSLISAGFRVGDVVRFTGLTGGLAPLNAGNRRIVALTATQMTIDPAGPLSQTAQTTFTITAAGRKLLAGTTLRSFTVEQSYPDIDVSELFVGCRFGGANIQVPPSGMVTCGFQLQGINGTLLSGAQSPHFATPTAAPNTTIGAGAGGALRFAGASRGIVTGMDIAIQRSLQAPPVVGSVIAPDVFVGRLTVTGNVQVFLEDQTILNAFYSEQEVELGMTVETSGGATPDFLSFWMSRVKLSAANKQIGAEGGVILQCPYQALLASGTGVDASTLVIQRSNA